MPSLIFLMDSNKSTKLSVVPVGVVVIIQSVSYGAIKFVGVNPNQTMGGGGGGGHSFFYYGLRHFFLSSKFMGQIFFQTRSRVSSSITNLYNTSE